MPGSRRPRRVGTRHLRAALQSGAGAPHSRSRGLLIAAAILHGCAGARPPPLSQTPYGIVLRSPAGVPFDLAELQGKVTLVTFFATWCLPCMLEVPVLKALQHDLSPRGFEVVAIGMDLEGAKVLDPFVRTAQPNYRVLLADDALREGRSPFGEVQQVPTTFLLDREGRIVLAYAGVVPPTLLRERILRLL